MKEMENEIIKCKTYINIDKNFSDNPLKILEKLYYSIKFNLKIDIETKKSIVKNGRKLKFLEQEKKNKVLEKIFKLQGGIYKFVLLLN